MTFDPLRPLSPLPPVPPARPELRTADAKGGAAFEQALARMLAESAGAGGEKEKMMAEMVRLQLMRSTVSLSFDEGPEEDRLLPALLPRFSVAGQNPDPYAESSGGAVQNPSARLPGPSSAPSPKTSSVDDIAERAARRYQVAPELVRAVIKAESGFNPRAVSPAGAQGLMQLMPGTARDMGVADAFDPEQNVMGGTRYLRMMLDRYDGNLEKALAAYNWGPGNLDRSDGSLPRETRDYVARIRGFLAKEA